MLIVNIYSLILDCEIVYEKPASYGYLSKGNTLRIYPCSHKCILYFLCNSRLQNMIFRVCLDAVSSKKRDLQFLNSSDGDYWPVSYEQMQCYSSAVG